MDRIARGLASLLTLLIVVVPTVQLMSPASATAPQHLTSKATGKHAPSSRIPVVTGTPIALERAPAADGRIQETEPRHAAAGFGAAPFVPPRV